jgi:hypothetical protein
MHYTMAALGGKKASQRNAGVRFLWLDLAANLGLGLLRSVSSTESEKRICTMQISKRHAKLARV